LIINVLKNKFRD